MEVPAGSARSPSVVGPTRSACFDDGMVAGGVIIVIILLILPVIIIISMAAIAAGLGWLLKDDVDAEFVDSEFLELGK